MFDTYSRSPLISPLCNQQIGHIMQLFHLSASSLLVQSEQGCRGPRVEARTPSLGRVLLKRRRSEVHTLRARCAKAPWTARPACSCRFAPSSGVSPAIRRHESCQVGLSPTAEPRPRRISRSPSNKQTRHEHRVCLLVLSPHVPLLQ